MIIAQETLKEKISYDSLGGGFLRKKRAGYVPAGTISKGYVRIMVNGKIYPAHRLAWLYVYGVMPDGQIDHINHDKSDNRIDNLREVSHSENQKNKPLCRRNKTGYNGVGWIGRLGKWTAYISEGGKTNNIGLFSDVERAIEARRLAEKRLGFHENHGI